MAYLFFLLLTIYVSSRADLMYENITGVSTMPEYHLLVIGFTLLSAIFFAYKMLKILHLLKHHKKSIIFLIIFAAVLMSIGAFAPYTINQKDFLSQLHVFCSMIPSLVFIGLIFIYNHFLSLNYPQIYIQIHWFYDLGVQFLALLLIIFTRVNGYLEIFFTLLICSYLYIIEKRVSQLEDS
ncbi:hypothetical protein [Candidatus Stoquefichus massiliensis]|uniref:hypothetical protein n=1 Tax=Candidatus Stoquefichus massiliensis TaxID=1470350 RepID=UPI000485FE6D|nr:hypothetical protein [Candidatus Stoquefichus massiliensis]